MVAFFNRCFSDGQTSLNHTTALVILYQWRRVAELASQACIGRVETHLTMSHQSDRMPHVSTPKPEDEERVQRACPDERPFHAWTSQDTTQQRAEADGSDDQQYGVSQFPMLLLLLPAAQPHVASAAEFHGSSTRSAMQAT